MIAFVHIYKTAGTTFSVLLRNHFGVRHLDRFGFRERWLCAEDLRRIKWIYPGLKSLGGHPVRPMSDLDAEEPDLRYYTFLREPVARAASHFCWFLSWKCNDKVMYPDIDKVFRRWATARENRNRQCKHLSASGRSAESLEMLDQKQMLVLRVDRFTESLLLFQQWAEEPEMDLHVKERNTQADARKRLSGETGGYVKRIEDFQQRLKHDAEYLEILQEMNGEDLQVFEKVKKEIWPRQVDGYKGDLTVEKQCMKSGRRSSPEKPDDTLFARAYRNVIYKPIRPLLLPGNEPEVFRRSEWY